MSYLGVDLGGTMTKAALVDVETGIWTTLEPCATIRSTAAETVAGLVSFITDLLSEYPCVQGLGVTIPGHVDEEGRAVMIPNVPGQWRGQAVKSPVEEASGLQVTMMNDANAFGFAELYYGAARGVDRAIGMALGTGIGGVIIIDGKVIEGRQGRAGELGHQVLIHDGEPCGCGNWGCLGSVASSFALTRKAGKDTVHEVVLAAQAGDKQAKKSIEEAATWLGIGLGNLAMTLDPELIFIGGGIAQAGELLFAPIREVLAERAPLIPADDYRVVPAELGTQAGAIGVALAASFADR